MSAGGTDRGAPTGPDGPPLGCLIGTILLVASPGLIALAVVLPLLDPYWYPAAVLGLVLITLLFLGLAWGAGAFGGRARTPEGTHPDGDRRDR